MSGSISGFVSSRQPRFTGVCQLCGVPIDLGIHVTKLDRDNFGSVSLIACANCAHRGAAGKKGAL
jgi:hypothetical protein